MKNWMGAVIFFSSLGFNSVCFSQDFEIAKAAISLLSDEHICNELKITNDQIKNFAEEKDKLYRRAIELEYGNKQRLDAGQRQKIQKALVDALNNCLTDVLSKSQKTRLFQLANQQLQSDTLPTNGVLKNGSPFKLDASAVDEIKKYEREFDAEAKKIHEAYLDSLAKLLRQRDEKISSKLNKKDSVTYQKKFGTPHSIFLERYIFFRTIQRKEYTEKYLQNRKMKASSK